MLETVPPKRILRTDRVHSRWTLRMQSGRFSSPFCRRLARTDACRAWRFTRSCGYLQPAVIRERYPVRRADQEGVVSFLNVPMQPETSYGANPGLDVPTPSPGK